MKNLRAEVSPDVDSGIVGMIFGWTALCVATYLHKYTSN